MIKTKIPDSWGIPAELKNRFGTKGVGKQRAMTAEGHYLLILHRIAKHDSKEKESVIFWKGPTKDWVNNHRDKGIYHLRRIIEEFSLHELTLDKRYEKAQSPEDYFDLLEELTPLVRSSQGMAKAFQQLREISSDADIIDLRDLAQEVASDFEILYTDARNGLDYTIAKRAEEQAQYSMATSKSNEKLNILVALFLPVTALSGIFGMNFQTGLENKPAILFWIVTVIAFLLGFGVKNWILNDKKTDS